MDLEWWQWLITPVSVLRVKGLNPGYRFQHTSHRGPLGRRWALSIGYWGGVAPAKEIMNITGSDRNSYNNFRMRWKLKTMGRASADTEAIHPAEIASAVCGIIASSDLDKPKAAHLAATRLGILPIEARRYADAGTHILSVSNVSPEELFADESSDLWIQLWDQLGMDIRLPEKLVLRIAHEYEPV